VQNLRAVGIYREMYRKDKPELKPLSESYTTRIIGDRDRIADYMQAGTPVFDVMEDVVDMVDGREWIRSGPTLVSDGEWIWRLDSIHYLRNYSLDMPQEFVDHVRRQNYQPPGVIDVTDARYDTAIAAYF